MLNTKNRVYSCDKDEKSDMFSLVKKIVFVKILSELIGGWR